jgi:hypothetical protein
MSTVRVFRNDKEVFQSNISNQFSIRETSLGDLVWFDNTAKQHGTLQVWVQAIGFKPRLAFLYPHWQLIVDSARMEQKFYPLVEDLKGKEVELCYKEYRFVFQFD